MSPTNDPFYHEDNLQHIINVLTFQIVKDQNGSQLQVPGSKHPDYHELALAIHGRISRALRKKLCRNVDKCTALIIQAIDQLKKADVLDIVQINKGRNLALTVGICAPSRVPALPELEKPKGSTVNRRRQRSPKTQRRGSPVFAGSH